MEICTSLDDCKAPSSMTFIYVPIFFIENDRFCNKPTSNQFYYVECSHWHVQEKIVFFIKFDILN